MRSGSADASRKGRERLDLRALQKSLEAFEFGPALTEHLGWTQPQGRARTWHPLSSRNQALEQRVVAELEGAVVLEVRSRDGSLPASRERERASKEVARKHPEHLLLFVDSARTRSLWCWVERKEGRTRTLVYVRGQSSQRLFDRLVTLHLDLQGQGLGSNVSAGEVARKLRATLDEARRADASFQIPPAIARYLCERTLHQVILDAVQPEVAPKGHSHRTRERRFGSFDELLLGLDDALCRRLLHEVLPNLKVLDPACGTGALLVEALEVLASLWSAVLWRAEQGRDKALVAEARELRREHGEPSTSFRRQIVTRNLFGMALEEESTQRTRQRLLQEAPGAEVHIHVGNALTGGVPFGVSEGFDVVVTHPPWGEGPERHTYEAPRKRRGAAHTRRPLYQSFIERAFEWLRPGGQAGLFVPSNFYLDQSASGLRQVLLEGGALRAVLGLSNGLRLLVGVHSSFKFCVLIFARGQSAETFEAAFKVDPRDAVGEEELDAFLWDSSSHLELTPAFIRRLSAHTLRIPELQSTRDILVLEKLTRFPPLGPRDAAGWRLELGPGLHWARTRKLMVREGGNEGLLPLCQGRMLHQYRYDDASPTFWLEEAEVRTKRRGGNVDPLAYRLAFRNIARRTDGRTMVATVLPPRVLCEQTVTVERARGLDAWARLYLVALLNSFVVDYFLRQQVGHHLSHSMVMELPIPPLETSDGRLRSIAVRAARLICTTPAYDALAREVGLRGHQEGAVTFGERVRLRAEIEGLVAHLYGLTEEEFAHVLSTFPLVPEPERVAARNAWRDVAHGIVE